MNKPKCTEYDYISFLVAAQRVFSTPEAARTQPYGESVPAQDADTRLLQRLPADSADLWAEVRACIVLDMGLLVVRLKVQDTNRRDRFAASLLRAHASLGGHDN